MIWKQRRKRMGVNSPVLKVYNPPPRAPLVFGAHRLWSCVAMRQNLNISATRAFVKICLREESMDGKGNATQVEPITYHLLVGPWPQAAEKDRRGLWDVTQTGCYEALVVAILAMPRILNLYFEDLFPPMKLAHEAKKVFGLPGINYPDFLHCGRACTHQLVSAGLALLLVKPCANLNMDERI